MEHPPTLADLQREADRLEFTLDTSTGYLDLRKRSDPSTFFSSLQPHDDPRVLAGAWEFLQHYRAQLATWDRVRSRQTPRKRSWLTRLLRRP